MTSESEPLEPSDDAGDEIEFISDGEGLAIIGNAAAVERFVTSTGLPSRQLDLARVNSTVAKSGALMSTASEVSANAGRWMKLTEESARALSSRRSARTVRSSSSAAKVLSRPRPAHRAVSSRRICNSWRSLEQC